jgi:signal transduction histidine kinase
MSQRDTPISSSQNQQSPQINGGGQNNQENEAAPFDETINHFRVALHDYQAMLVAAKFRADELAFNLRSEGSPYTDEAEELVRVLNLYHSALRLLMLNMRMPSLGNHTISEAILEYANLLLSKDTVLSLIGSESISQFPHIAEVFFIISREAIANAVRHAEAKHIIITIQNLGVESTLEVADDGRGFDPNKTIPGNGISYMTSIIESLGGKLLIESKPGSGTCLKASAPLRMHE